MAAREESLPHGTLIYTDEGHAITTDSLLLANFSVVHSRFSACDLGCGSGILLLSLIDKGLQGRAVGVEQDPCAVQLLRQAALANQLPQLSVIQDDLKVYQTDKPFDVVISNPPYFNNGFLPKGAARARARHELSATIADICQAAFRLLKDGGRLYLCWPAGRMQSLFAALEQNALAPKRMQLVRRTPQDEPWLLLMDARRNGGEGLTILPDILLPAGSPVHY